MNKFNTILILMFAPMLAMFLTAAAPAPKGVALEVDVTGKVLNTNTTILYTNLSGVSIKPWTLNTNAFDVNSSNTLRAALLGTAIQGLSGAKITASTLSSNSFDSGTLSAFGAALSGAAIQTISGAKITAGTIPTNALTASAYEALIGGGDGGSSKLDPYFQLVSPENQMGYTINAGSSQVSGLFVFDVADEGDGTHLNRYTNNIGAKLVYYTISGTWFLMYNNLVFYTADGTAEDPTGLTWTKDKGALPVPTVTATIGYGTPTVMFNDPITISNAVVVFGTNKITAHYAPVVDEFLYVSGSSVTAANGKYELIEVNEGTPYWVWSGPNQYGLFCNADSEVISLTNSVGATVATINYGGYPGATPGTEWAILNFSPDGTLARGTNYVPNGIQFDGGPIAGSGRWLTNIGDPLLVPLGTKTKTWKLVGDRNMYWDGGSYPNIFTNLVAIAPYLAPLSHPYPAAANNQDFYDRVAWANSIEIFWSTYLGDTNNAADHSIWFIMLGGVDTYTSANIVTTADRLDAIMRGVRGKGTEVCIYTVLQDMNSGNTVASENNRNYLNNRIRSSTNWNYLVDIALMFPDMLNQLNSGVVLTAENKMKVAAATEEALRVGPRRMAYSLPTSRENWGRILGGVTTNLTLPTTPNITLYITNGVIMKVQ